MLCYPISNFETVPTDGMVEFRFDLSSDCDLQKIAVARRKCCFPIIFKIKDLKQIPSLVTLKPDYIDLDHSIDPIFFDSLKKEYHEIKWIISFHDFEKTPQDLEHIYYKMKDLGGDLYKMACYAHSFEDARRVFELSKRDPQLMTIAMGERGEFTRIMNQKWWTFAALTKDQATAPGQLTKEELSLYKKGRPYALIGMDLTKRPSHLFHNAVMQDYGAFYLKIEVEPHEITSFLRFARENGFGGLSVTNPLKEVILPYLDEIDPYAKAIGAVNTVLFQAGKSFGFNTDGKGALDVVERAFLVKDKRVVVVGCGGAGKAIIYEAIQRGAHVFVYNRTFEKAVELSQKWNITPLREVETCDVLINTTPCLPKYEGHPWLMDISGNLQMWLEQAIGQYEIWMPGVDIKERLKGAVDCFSR